MMSPATRAMVSPGAPAGLAFGSPGAPAGLAFPPPSPSPSAASAAAAPTPPARPMIFFSPAKVFGDSAETLLAWLKMRCVDGIVPGGAPGIVLTGRAGCGKVTTVRWAMRKLGIEDSALQVFHPWSSESALSVERSLINAAVTTPPRKCAVLVLRQAELWALRSAARDESDRRAVPGAPRSASSGRSTTTLAYWTKLVARLCGAGQSSALPRVAIVLCFPDLSLARARTLVGLRGEDAPDREQGRKKRANAAAAAWKHIDLDDHMLRNLGQLSVRISRFLEPASETPLPFDGDMRALYRRRADPCRANAPRHLDLNYNIFRASMRLLDGISLSAQEVTTAVEADHRLVDMIWSHSATHCTGMNIAACVRDREVWSRMDVRNQLRDAPGWGVLEWRMARGVPDKGRIQVAGLRFERVPRKLVWKGLGTTQPAIPNRRNIPASACVRARERTEDEDWEDEHSEEQEATSDPALALQALRSEYDFSWNAVRS
jgi:hypothetical protein